MRPGYRRCWAIRKPGPLGAEQRAGRDADVLVEDLGVVAVAPEALVGVLHRGDVTDDPNARGVSVDDQHRSALVGPRVGVGDHHHDQEVGDRAVGGEPLVAVDHPLVAVTDGAGLQQRRVRAGGVGLGHAERRLQIAGQQRVQVALLLLGGAGEREDLRVTRVRRRVAEHQRRDRARAEDLVHQAELDLAKALAAELRVQVRGPQTLFLDLLLQRPGGAPQPLPSELARKRLERPDVLAHERAHPLQFGLELGLGGEIPAHVPASVPAWRRVGRLLPACTCL